MSTIINPVNNAFDFQCNCGFQRFVTDAEIWFQCERPVYGGAEDKCKYLYQQTPNGAGAGIPTVARFDLSGNNQSDPAVLLQSSPLGGEIAASDAGTSDPAATALAQDVSAAGTGG